MFQTILFDLDGTLTDPREGITKSVQYALEHFGIEEPDLEKLEFFIGPPLKEEFMRYCGFDETKGREAVDKYRERFSTIGLFENKMFEGVDGMLETLKESGKKIAVASSKPTIFVERILAHFNIQKYFDVIVGSELDGTRTDKAEVVAEALRQLGVEQACRESIVMVGDRKHDVMGARKEGVDSIGVLFGFGGRKELEEAGAAHIVASVTELTTLLLK